MGISEEGLEEGKRQLDQLSTRQWVNEMMRMPLDERNQIDHFMARMINFHYHRLNKYISAEDAYWRYFGRPW